MGNNTETPLDKYIGANQKEISVMIFVRVIIFLLFVISWGIEIIKGQNYEPSAELVAFIAAVLGIDSVKTYLIRKNIKMLK